MPCSYDFNLAATKYFYGLDEGEVPLTFLFSGTIFYQDGAGALQVCPVPWSKEAQFRLPVPIWQRLMDAYYPEPRLAQLRRDVFDRLYQYKVRQRHPDLGAGAGSHAPGRGRRSAGMSRDDRGRGRRALLYEGYMLYPYRPSSVKNRQRCNFGVLYPERYSRGQDGVDPWLMQTECLVLGDAGPVSTSRWDSCTWSRGPSSSRRTPARPSRCEVDRLVVGDRIYQTWQEAVERRVRVERLRLGDLVGQATTRPFAFPDSDEREPISAPGGGTAGFDPPAADGHRRRDPRSRSGRSARPAPSSGCGS